METKLRDPNCWLLGAAVFLHVPVATLYSIRMWGYGHYQFFPLLIAVVAYLFYSDRRRIIDGTNPGNSAISMLMFSLVLCTGLVGAFSLWKFACAISLLMLVITTLYWLFGWTGLRRTAPLVFLLFIIVPLPGGLGNFVINKMQVLASNLASWTLDAFGFIHFREGVILITQKDRFFTEEACSGIRSLYSSLAGIAIYSVINRYPWWRFAGNLVQTVGWVLIGNAFRIAIVVYVADNWTRAIADGTAHEMLGIVVFVGIIFLATSTDRCLSAFLPDSSDMLPAGTSEGTEIAVESTGLNVWGRMPKYRPTIVLVVMFLFVGVICNRVAFKQIYKDKLYDVGFLASNRLPFLAESDLPDQIGGWKRIGFEHIHRGSGRVFAEDSFTWTYSNGINNALISVDCPWHEFHDLTACYRGIGWDVNSEMLQLQNDSSRIEDFSYKQTNLSRRSGESGVVLFSGIDRELKEVLGLDGGNVIGTYATKVLSRLLGPSAGIQEQFGVALPVTMVQVYCEPRSKLTDSQVVELRSFFVNARSHVAASRRFAATSSE